MTSSTIRPSPLRPRAHCRGAEGTAAGGGDGRSGREQLRPKRPIRDGRWEERTSTRTCLPTSPLGEGSVGDIARPGGAVRGASGRSSGGARPSPAAFYAPRANRYRVTERHCWGRREARRRAFLPAVGPGRPPLGRNVADAHRIHQPALDAGGLAKLLGREFCRPAPQQPLPRARPLSPVITAAPPSRRPLPPLDVYPWGQRARRSGGSPCCS
jgi:hypothetical protein